MTHPVPAANVIDYIQIFDH